ARRSPHPRRDSRRTRAREAAAGVERSSGHDDGIRAVGPRCVEGRLPRAAAMARRQDRAVRGPRVIVERYLTALTGHDWSELRDCLSSDVVRVGPYNDDYRGADAYAQFLEKSSHPLPQ